MKDTTANLHKVAAGHLKKTPSKKTDQLFIALLPPHKQPSSCVAEDFLWLLVDRQRTIGTVTRWFERETGFAARLIYRDDYLSEDVRLRTLNHFKDDLVVFWAELLPSDPSKPSSSSDQRTSFSATTPTASLQSQGMDLTPVNHSVKGSAENLPGPTASAPSLSSAKITTSFKFMYPEALPVPEGVDNVEWNKVYVAANVSFYSKNGKSAAAAKTYRLSGDTYKLALAKLAERRRLKGNEAQIVNSKEHPSQINRGGAFGNAPAGKGDGKLSQGHHEPPQAITLLNSNVIVPTQRNEDKLFDTSSQARREATDNKDSPSTSYRITTSESTKVTYGDSELPPVEPDLASPLKSQTRVIANNFKGVNPYNIDGVWIDLLFFQQNQYITAIPDRASRFCLSDAIANEFKESVLRSQLNPHHLTWDQFLMCVKVAGYPNLDIHKFEFGYIADIEVGGTPKQYATRINCVTALQNMLFEHFASKPLDSPIKLYIYSPPGNPSPFGRDIEDPIRQQAAIPLLAAKARTDTAFRALMRRVSSGKASTADEAHFQMEIEELTRSHRE